MPQTLTPDPTAGTPRCDMLIDVVRGLDVVPQGAGRELQTRVFHTTAPWPQLIFPTLLAVLIPAWLYHHRVRLPIEWMFI